MLARLDGPTGPIVTVLSTDPATGYVRVHRKSPRFGCLTFSTSRARLHPYQAPCER